MTGRRVTLLNPVPRPRPQVYTYVVLCVFTILVYASSSDLGSPSKVWDNLTTMAKPGNFPVEYNLDGSYLTMWSRGGLIFGIINIIGASLPFQRLNEGFAVCYRCYRLNGRMASSPSEPLDLGEMLQQSILCTADCYGSCARIFGAHAPPPSLWTRRL